MIYIYNTNLSDKKKLRSALCNIHGVGAIKAQHLCDLIGVSSNTKINQLSISNLERLSQVLHQNHTIGPEVRRKMRENRQRLVNIGSYRGFRFVEGLPCRGQRTHGNARIARRLKRGLN
ncbi:30S ribosomal protein S13 [bacterium]|nr:MAG: 30S ribosomal protein S13 [bacterium]